MLLAASAWPAVATAHRAIDFETYAVGTPVPEGARVSDQYAPWGAASFTTTAGRPVIRRLGLAGQSGLNTLAGDGPGNPSTHPIEIAFSPDADDVQLRALDVGSNGLVVEAYDAGGGLVDSDSVVHAGDGAGQIDNMRVLGAGIVRVVIRQMGSDPADGYAIDDMFFHVVADDCGNFVIDEGEACDDGNAFPCDGCSPDCSEIDVVGCHIEGECVADFTLRAGNECELCDSRVDPLGWIPRAAGAACDDGRFCTVMDACDGDGACGGAPRTCDDALPCTTDACDDDVDECVFLVASGCVIDGACVPVDTVNPDNPCEICLRFGDDRDWSPRPAGVPCDDGAFCTAGDACDGFGGCAGAPRSCDDALTCTADRCDESAGACRSTVTGGCAIDGACVPARATHPADPCLACRPLVSTSAWSRVDPGTACDDGRFCTVEDACASDGACVGEARDCSDGLSCTRDACDEALGECTHVTDALRTCTIDGDCVADGARDPDDPCSACVVDVSTSAWTRLPAGSPCSDGRFCTVGDACDGSGACTGAARDCGDGLSCTDDRCDEAGRACTRAVVMGCAIDGACFAEGAVNPFAPCERCVGATDPRGWTVADDGESCDDGRFCTVDDRCASGACEGAPRGDCDDGLSCTDDRCDGAADRCVATPLDACLIGGSCVEAGAVDPRDPCRECRPTDETRGYVARAEGAVCGGPSCREARASGPAACDAEGACVGEPEPCAGGLVCADAERCREACDGDEDCVGARHCEDGACAEDGALGAPCDRDGECESGACADAVCCDETCAGPCVACGDDGRCAPHPEGTDPERGCLNGLCDGAGSCGAVVGVDAGPPGDAGTPDAGPGGSGSGGCGCRASSGAGGGAWLLLLPLFALRRRRPDLIL